MSDRYSSRYSPCISIDEENIEELSIEGYLFSPRDELRPRPPSAE